MTTVAASDRKHVVVVKTLLTVAVLGTLAAVAAGLILLVGSPAAGSDAEATLGFTAAAGGLSAAIFFGAAAIYAQIRGLWKYAPPWVRATSWVVLAVVVISSLWGSLTEWF